MAVASDGVDHMQVIAPHSRYITTSAPHHSVFIGWMLFLLYNQQCQSTESNPFIVNTKPLTVINTASLIDEDGNLICEP